MPVCPLFSFQSVCCPDQRILWISLWESYSTFFCQCTCSQTSLCALSGIPCLWLEHTGNERALSSHGIFLALSTTSRLLAAARQRGSGPVPFYGGGRGQSEEGGSTLTRFVGVTNFPALYLRKRVHRVASLSFSQKYTLIINILNYFKVVKLYYLQ